MAILNDGNKYRPFIGRCELNGTFRSGLENVYTGSMLCNTGCQCDHMILLKYLKEKTLPVNKVKE